MDTNLMEYPVGDSIYLDKLIKQLERSSRPLFWRNSEGVLEKCVLTELPLDRVCEIIHGWLKKGIVPLKLVQRTEG